LDHIAILHHSDEGDHTAQWERVDHDVAELAIGHARDGLRRQYDFAQLWDLRGEAFAKVSDHVTALLEQPSGKVIPLAGSRGRRR
jgi:hypothetical protein